MFPRYTNDICKMKACVQVHVQLLSRKTLSTSTEKLYSVSHSTTYCIDTPPYNSAQSLALDSTYCRHILNVPRTSKLPNKHVGKTSASLTLQNYGKAPIIDNDKNDDNDNDFCDKYKAEGEDG